VLVAELRRPHGHQQHGVDVAPLRQRHELSTLDAANRDRGLLRGPSRRPARGARERSSVRTLSPPRCRTGRGSGGEQFNDRSQLAAPIELGADRFDVGFGDREHRTSMAARATAGKRHGPRASGSGR